MKSRNDEIGRRKCAAKYHTTFVAFYTLRKEKETMKDGNEMKDENNVSLTAIVVGLAGVALANQSDTLPVPILLFRSAELAKKIGPAYTREGAEKIMLSNPSEVFGLALSLEDGHELLKALLEILQKAFMSPTQLVGEQCGEG